MISTAFTQEITQLHANICSALADPNRILILYALYEKPCSVNTLAEEINISQSAASRHLSLLRERGLIVSRREGQSVVNELNDMRVIQALDLMRAVLTSNLKNQGALAGSVAANLAESTSQVSEENE
jgi:ArsR family transcriptional regulator